MKILSSVCVVRKQYTLFDTVEFHRRYRKNTFALGDAYLMPLSQHVQYLSVHHMEKQIRRCDTGGFVPVVSLNCVVGLKYLFVRSLIGSTRKI